MICVNVCNYVAVNTVRMCVYLMCLFCYALCMHVRICFIACVCFYVYMCAYIMCMLVYVNAFVCLFIKNSLEVCTYTVHYIHCTMH